jgi:hypothetical protein
MGGLSHEKASNLWTSARGAIGWRVGVSAVQGMCEWGPGTDARDTTLPAAWGRARGGKGRAQNAGAEGRCSRSLTASMLLGHTPPMKPSSSAMNWGQTFCGRRGVCDGRQWINLRTHGMRSFVLSVVVRMGPSSRGPLQGCKKPWRGSWSAAALPCRRCSHLPPPRPPARQPPPQPLRAASER